MLTTQTLWMTGRWLNMTISAIIVLSLYVIIDHSTVKPLGDSDLWSGLYMATLIMIFARMVLSTEPQAPLETTNIVTRYIIYSTLLSPIIEEVIFRQVMYNSLITQDGNKWPARIITSLLFIVLHFPTTDIQWIYYTLCTIALQTVYEKSDNNLHVAIGYHVLYNLTTLL